MSRQHEQSLIPPQSTRQGGTERTQKAASFQPTWESLQDTCPSLEKGECLYLKQDLFPIIAKRHVEKGITKLLRQYEEDAVSPTTYKHRSDMENILVFLVATIEAGEQILTVADYHKVWVAVCFNPTDGLIQDYTMKYDSDGYPYCPPAEDFSGQYPASFRVRRKNALWVASSNKRPQEGDKVCPKQEI